MCMKKLVKGLLPGLWVRDSSIKLKYRFRLNIRKNLFIIRMEKLEYISYGSCMTGSVQDQVGQNLQQHNFMQNVELDGLQRSLPTQTIG